MTRPLLTPERVAALRTETKEWVRKSPGSLAMLLRLVLDAYVESERRRGRLREAVAGAARALDRCDGVGASPEWHHERTMALGIARAALEEDDRDGA